MPIKPDETIPPRPIPVSERLPKPFELDDYGSCWWFTPPACWTFAYEAMDDDTHWLPHWALPLPKVKS